MTDDSTISTRLPVVHPMDFYQRMRKDIDRYLAEKGRVGRLAQWLLAAPDLFHLIFRLGLEPSVALREKIRFGLMTAYILNPFDILPEAILGPGGLLDDLWLAAWMVDRFINGGGALAAQRLWAGPDDLLDVVRSILRYAPGRLAQAGAWRRVVRFSRRVVVR